MSGDRGADQVNDGQRAALDRVAELAAASRKATHAADAARAARDTAILDAIRLNLSMRTIGAEADLSHTIVHRVAARLRTSGGPRGCEGKR